jgi:hypothetical protein
VILALGGLTISSDAFVVTCCTIALQLQSCWWTWVASHE